MKDFKIGEAVLFCNGWGDTYDNSKMYRWGDVRAGFITDIEYIEASNTNLYVVGVINPFNKTQVGYRTLGEHLIFKVDEYDKALEKLKEICAEVER